MAYHWPGNVRELENMIKRMVVLGNEQAVLQEIQQPRGAGRPGCAEDDGSISTEARRGSARRANGST